MRWKLSLAVLAMAMAANANSASGQEVPLTVTLEPRNHKHPVDAVSFYLPDGTQLGETVQEPGGNPEQTYVGDVPRSGSPARYHVTAVLQIANADHVYEFSFGVEDDCSEATDRSLKRIACSAVRHGAGLVCTAMYAGMDELGKPGDTCGSHACVYCSRIKVCGANPECP